MPVKRTNGKITYTTYSNGLGIKGYDRGCRSHFSTLCLGSRGIAVSIVTLGGKRRYMEVTGVQTHFGAYEVARKLAPVETE